MVFGKLRLSVGDYLLIRAARRLQRKRGVYNMDDSKSIALVYNATNKQDYEKVKAFVNYFKEKHKQVLSLGYIDSTDPNMLLKTQLEFRFFTKKELNWHFKPSGLEINNFLDDEFDILIDLSLEDCFPLRYVSGLSKAKFKVGNAGKNSTLFYDMVIDVGDKKTLENFIDNVKHYLSMINKGAENNQHQHV